MHLSRITVTVKELQYNFQYYITQATIKLKKTLQRKKLKMLVLHELTGLRNVF